MSIENFIHEMPKVELNIRLEGALLEDRLLVIAEQNEIEETLKGFAAWAELVKNPDYTRIEEIIPVITSWLQQPEDVAHVVYELGVTLAKQNVRYAEISVNPALFTENGFTFETLLAALNDGRDRAQRGWGIRMGWILAISRDNPRTADEIARWASNVASKKGGVIGLGLVGQEDAQPIGQFERAFHTAAKKDVPRLPNAGSILAGDGIVQVMEHLAPDRIADGWGAIDSAEAMDALLENHVPLNIFMTRALRAGQIESYADYPLRRLLDDEIVLALGTGMPALYHTSIEDEYLAAVEQGGLSLEELQTLALNAVRMSCLSATEKQAMVSEFEEAYAMLSAESVTDTPAS
ncbi:MAG: hypothetical protein K8L99_20680 [Anaerolineae bacterium]|nr:hypothetical protein [Anaerolineae bacterium]